MKPSISIVAPVYNVEEYLEKCLDSILEQTIQDFEVILVYDNSDDDSLSICKRYADEHENINLIVREINEGHLSGARNAGIRAAKGDYILFVDTDNYCHRELCEKALNAAVQYNADAVHFNVVTVEDRPYITDPLYDPAQQASTRTGPYDNTLLTKLEYMRETFKMRINFASFQAMYKRDVVVKNNIFYTVDKSNEDIYFYISMMPYVERAYMLSDSLVAYRAGRPYSISAAHEFDPAAKAQYFDAFFHVIDFILNKAHIYGFSDDNIFEYCRVWYGKIAREYLIYQHCAMDSLFYCDGFDKNKAYILFGASSFGMKQYIKIRHLNLKVYFCDNDKSKWGTEIDKKTILSPQDLKNIYDPESCRIIITSTYFLEIAVQLTESNTISNVKELLPFRGNTPWDKMYAEVLDGVVKRITTAFDTYNKQ